MNEEALWLDADRAHRGGKDLALSGGAIRRQRESLGGRIAAASASPPWGRDDIGAQFEKTYRQLESQILEFWRDVGGAVEGLGGNVTRAVNASVRTDVANGHRIGRTGRH